MRPDLNPSPWPAAPAPEGPRSTPAPSPLTEPSALAWDGGKVETSPPAARWQDRHVRRPRQPPPPGVLTRWLP